MGEVLALSRGFGVIRAGGVLAFPGSISERSAKQISGSADELIRNIASVMENLVASAIEKRTAAEFIASRELIFPKYTDAVLALSSLVRIVIPQEVIERLNREFFCELEADLRDRGLTAFGTAVRDQAMFTVWTLRKISDYLSQIASAPLLADGEKQRAAAEIGNDCMFHAIRTRFHIHCLVSAMAMNRPVNPDVVEALIEGLRSVVNAFGLARRLLDLLVPYPTPSLEPVEWDEEDQDLLREATYDMVSETA